MKIYDISMPLHADMMCWPGDGPFVKEEQCRLAAGDGANVARVSMTLHHGSHIDAPAHFVGHAPSVDALDLGIFVGSARVVSVHTDRLVEPTDLAEILAGRPERLLLHCNPGRNVAEFSESFVSVSSEAAWEIGGSGVRLLGIDAPSVDAFGENSMEVHQAFWEKGTIILENLVLEGVPDGEYELIALPLRILGGDASPVRAILRKT